MIDASSPVLGRPSYPSAAKSRWSSIEPNSPIGPGALQHAAIPMIFAPGAVPNTSKNGLARFPKGRAAIVDETNDPWLWP